MLPRKRSNHTVIIVAGGRGKRMNRDLPKQFLLLGDFPVLMHTLWRFYLFNNQIKLILVLPEDEISTWKTLCRQHNFNLSHKVVEGGKERFDSVKNALNHIHTDGLVAVHDGVRPFVSNDTIVRCFEKAEQAGAVIPVVDLTESLRYFEMDNKSIAVDRGKYRIVQTPQVFRSEILIAAYTQPFTSEFTDDASVIEKYGYPIAMVEGNRENIKITTPFDLDVARMLYSVDTSGLHNPFDY